MRIPPASITWLAAASSIGTARGDKVKFADFTDTVTTGSAVFVTKDWMTGAVNSQEPHSFSWTIDDGQATEILKVNLYVDGVRKANVSTYMIDKPSLTVATPSATPSVQVPGSLPSSGVRSPRVPSPIYAPIKPSRTYFGHKLIPAIKKRQSEGGPPLLTSQSESTGDGVDINLNATSHALGGTVIFPDFPQLTVFAGHPVFLQLVWDTTPPSYSYSRNFTVYPNGQEGAASVAAGSAPYNVDRPALPEGVQVGGGDSGSPVGTGGGGGNANTIPSGGGTSTFNGVVPVITGDPTTTMTTTASEASATSDGVNPGLPGSGAGASRSSSKLSTGAIAGIAVAAALIGLGLLAALIFCLIRRRRRNNRDSTVISPGGYGNRTPELIAQKEANAGVGVEVSPHSPYSDDGGAAGAHHAAVAARQHEEMPLAGGYRERDVHGSVGSGEMSNGVATAGAAADGGSLRGSQTGSGLAGRETPTAVRHLVEDGMTEDEIRRLEEEERELDQAIEQAGSGGGRR